MGEGWLGERIVSTGASVIWITGLSGAGKSTVAAALVPRLREKAPAVVHLDGDELREILGAANLSDQNHGRAGRLALALRYAKLCRVVAQPGVTVVIATISMFHEVHAWNRAHLPGYLEVYLRVPVDELRRRDPKGIYRRFDRGEIRDVAGLDLTVDEPLSPHLLIEPGPESTVDSIAGAILNAWQTTAQETQG